MKKQNKIHMIGNTHFDPVWLWTWDEAMSSIRSTFRSALDRMKEDPEFIYSFCTPPVFEWIKETDPVLFLEIKERALEGRWEMAEGWWLQPDCHIGLGESYVRHGLYGQRYLLENFGKVTECVFNVDSFGHNIMLPQILEKSGIKYYTIARPDKKEKELSDPLFVWESPDGSRVLCYRVGGEGGEIYTQDTKKAVTDASGSIEALGHDLMCVYGVSNHGGAPTKKAIADIRELGSGELSYDVSFGTITGFFKEQEQYQKKLPVIKDELFVKFFGPYLNENEVKKNGRKSEYTVLNAEKAAVISYLALQKAYPLEKLTSCWKDVLFNQFHDIVGGCCIKNAFHDARYRHGRALQTANEILHYSLQVVTAKIKMPGKNPDNAWNLAVWNLNAFPVTEYVEAEVQWAWEFDWYRDGISLTDEDGNTYPCQLIREYSIIPGFRSRFVFKATLPPLGYKCFAVCQTKEKSDSLTHSEAYTIENDLLKLEINRETGGIAYVYSKTENKVILKNVLLPFCREDEGDTWAFNISSYGKETEPFRLVSSEIVEQGNVRTTIKTKVMFRNSFIEQYFTLYEGETFIDSHYKVNFNEKHLVLKLSVGTLSEESIHTAAIPYGKVTRANDGQELPMNEWVSYGKISVLADSIFAYGVKDSDIDLSLLRSPIYGDLRLEEIDLNADYEHIGQGIAEGKIRILTEEPETAPAKAISFSNLPMVVVEANHNGTLPPTGQYLDVESASSLIKAVKLAEEQDGIIVRLYECDGKTDTVSLSVPAMNAKVELETGKFEIKTIKIIFDGSVREVNMIEF